MIEWRVLWGISSVGRAFGWQPKGQGFESPILHQIVKECVKIDLG